MCWFLKHLKHKKKRVLFIFFVIFRSRFLCQRCAHRIELFTTRVFKNGLVQWKILVFYLNIISFTCVVVFVFYSNSMREKRLYCLLCVQVWTGSGRTQIAQTNDCDGLNLFSCYQHNIWTVLPFRKLDRSCQNIGVNERVSLAERARFALHALSRRQNV